MSKLSAAIAAAALFYVGQASAVTTFTDRMAFAAQGQGAMSFLTLDNIGLDDAVPLPFSIGPLPATRPSIRARVPATSVC